MNGFNAEITRRAFAALAAPVALAGCSGEKKAPVPPPRDPAEWYAADLKDPHPVQVVRRPSPLDPGREVALFGLGGVRFPHLPGLPGVKGPIDQELGAKLIHYALRHGINFFDSGYKYEDGGSEAFFGAALAPHPRESFYFCTKAPPWNISTLADAKRIFAEQLKRTRMDYFDVYMLHSLIWEKDYERTFLKTGALDYFKEEKARGRILHLGFSFHGKPEFLQRLVDEGWAEVCTILVNGKDWAGPNRSVELCRILTEAKMPTIVMEPLCGGGLAHLRPAAHACLQKVAPKATDASWSLRFAAHPANVMTVLSGFTRFAHLKEDVETFAAGTYRPFTDEEHKVYADAIRLECGGGEGVACSQCRYCMPCPHGVDIPALFHFWNMRIKWRGLPDPANAGACRAFLQAYWKAVPPLRNAARCIGCGECRKKCPQWQFTIAQELVKIDNYFQALERRFPDLPRPRTRG